MESIDALLTQFIEYLSKAGFASEFFSGQATQTAGVDVSQLHFALN